MKFPYQQIVLWFPVWTETCTGCIVPKLTTFMKTGLGHARKAKRSHKMVIASISYIEALQESL